MDIAKLGLQVTSDGMDKANQSLDVLVVNSGKAEKATESLAKSSRNLTEAEKQQALATNTAAKSAIDNAIALEKQRNANDNVAGSFRRTANDISHAGKMSRVAGHDLKNMVYQINDVGSSLALGMPPMQVFLQQGTQIGQVFAGSSASLGQWAKALGLTNPIVLGVTAAVVALGSAFKLQMGSINESLGSVNQSSKFTADQLDFLKKKGVDTSITMGDAFKGYAKTLIQAANDNIAPTFSGINSWWKKTTKDMSKASADFFRMEIVGWSAILGGVGAIIDNMANMFQRFADYTANLFKGVFENIVGGINKTLNSVSRNINSYTNDPKNKELLWMYSIKPTSLNESRDENPFFGRSIHNTPFKSVTGTMRAAGMRAMNTLDQNIEDARDDRLSGKLESLKYKEPKEPKAKHAKEKKDPKDKSESVNVIAYTEEWKKFYGEAKQSVDAYQKSVDLMKETEGLSNLEKAKTLYYQGYINDIEKQNIEPKLKLIALEKELAKTKDEKTIKTINREIEATKAQIIVLTDKRKEDLKALAVTKANLDAEKAWLEIKENSRKTLEEQSKALDIQVKSLWMGADAAEAFAFKQSLINQVDKDYLAAHPEIMKTIEERTAAFEKNQSMQKLIDKSREWKDTMKDAFKSLVTGGSTFKEVLASIGQKLADMAANDLWEKIWNGGKMSAANDNGASGGLWSSVLNFGSSLFKKNALGGIYNSPSLSAYSGQVVNQPTPFMFANGAGIMGEAGPEGILPLKRGKDGKLGVSTDGGQMAVIQIVQNGVITQEEVVNIAAGVSSQVATAGYSAVSTKQHRATTYAMGGRR